MAGIEVVGIPAALIELSKVVIQTLRFLHQVKNASSQKRELRKEVELISPVLETLSSVKDDIEGDGDSDEQARAKWLHHKAQLSNQLSLLRTMLEDLISKVVSRGLARSLLWPREEKKCKEIMDSITRIEMHIQSLTAQNTNEIVFNTNQRISSLQQESQRKDILAWIPSLDFFARHRSVREQVTPGTAGAGKTVIASTAFEYLLDLCGKSPNHIVVCAYFNFRERNRQNKRATLGDILLQMLSDQRPIPYQIRDEFQTNNEKRAPTDKELLDFLQVVSKTYDRVYLVVDAADEFSEKHRSALFKALKTIHPKINIMVTARPIADIEHLLGDSIRHLIRADNHDLRVYVSEQINEKRRLSGMVRTDPSFKDEIVRIVIEKAKDMFLLAKLHMERLGRQISRKKVLDQLQLLPKDLDETYDDAIGRIQNEGESMSEFAFSVLIWLCFSQRPLYLSELRHALSVEAGQTDLDEYSIVQDDSDISSLCGGLVVIEGDDPVVNLVHYTTQEYLRVKLLELDFKPHHQIAEACLVYLSYHGIQQSRSSRADLLVRYPFVSYAAVHWATHAVTLSEMEPEMEDMIFDLLDAEASVVEGFLTDPLPRDAFGTGLPLGSDGWRDRVRPRGLHIAAHFGLVNIVLRLLEAGEDANLLDHAGQSLLHYAAWAGRTEVVRCLLERGADPNLAARSNKAMPLQFAAVRGHATIAKLLVDAGATIEHRSRFGRPALLESVLHKHLDVVKVLLDAGAATETTDYADMPERTSMFLACELDLPDYIKVLIEHGAAHKGDTGLFLLKTCADMGSINALAVMLHAVVGDKKELLSKTQALDRSLFKDNGDVIKSLLEFGARPALTWERDRPLIRRWASESWFKKLLLICSDSGASHATEPRDCRDCTQSWEQDQQRRYSQGKGNYHDFSSGVRPLSMDSNDEVEKAIQAEQIEPYLELTVPDSFTMVETIVITTESCDQGWSGLNQDMRGKYEFSNTWFDLFIQYNSEPRSPALQDRFQYNLNSTSTYKTHTNTFDVSGSDLIRADAVWRLRAGDTIRVYARAQYPGWVNYVRHCKVTLEGKELATKALNSSTASTTTIQTSPVPT